jgi:hypothetical protein
LGSPFDSRFPEVSAMPVVRIFGALALSALAAATVVSLTLLAATATIGVALSVSGSPVAAASSGNSCAAGIVDILTRSAGTMPYRMQGKLVQYGAVIEATTEVVPYLGMHVRIDTNGVLTELVLFEGHGWMDSGSGWTAVDSEQASHMMRTIDPWTVRALGEPQNAECHGLTVIDGVEYLDFSYVYAHGRIEAQSRLLVDARTGLSARRETRVLTGGALTATSTTDYTYDRTITVSPPGGVPLL